MIEIKKLSVGYDKVPVVRDLDFSVKSGEIVAIIGPNGSGKSTLIKTILRQIVPVSGEIIVDGEKIEDLSIKDFSKKVSAVLTGRIRTDYMTGFDVVSQGRFPYTNGIATRTKGDIKAVEEALLFLRISHLGSKDFSKMSDGEKQLVMIARAVAQDTPVMILDEPENHLDIRYKMEVLSALKELSLKKNKTIVMSLHDISFAKVVADKLLLINSEHEHSLLDDAVLLDDSRVEALFSIDKSKLYEGFWSVKSI